MAQSKAPLVRLRRRSFAQLSCCVAGEQMFVAKSERGRGLGDVLLFETFNRRCKTFPRSHLFVSSRNTPAVAIYHKFGFKQSSKEGTCKVRALARSLCWSLVDFLPLPYIFFHTPVGLGQG